MKKEIFLFLVFCIFFANTSNAQSSKLDGFWILNSFKVDAHSYTHPTEITGNPEVDYLTGIFASFVYNSNSTIQLEQGNSNTIYTVKDDRIHIPIGAITYSFSISIHDNKLLLEKISDGISNDQGFSQLKLEFKKQE